MGFQGYFVHGVGNMDMQKEGIRAMLGEQMVVQESNCRLFRNMRSHQDTDRVQLLSNQGAKWTLQVECVKWLFETT